jgi:hypothetical protein
MKRILLLVTLLFVLALGACHKGDMIFHLITPEAEVAGDVVPDEEVGATEPNPTPQPPCEVIKGNISTRTGEKIAHAPGDPNYEQVKIDEAAGERFFCSMEEAIEAGWRPVNR